MKFEERIGDFHEDYLKGEKGFRFNQICLKKVRVYVFLNVFLSPSKLSGPAQRY